jgi:hypothetical protein
MVDASSLQHLLELKPNPHRSDDGCDHLGGLMALVQVDDYLRLWNQIAWALHPGSSPHSCVTLGKLLTLSKPQFVSFMGITVLYL